MMDPILLTQRLLRFPSITPDCNEIIDFLVELLSTKGFTCHKLKYGDVTNLYAHRGIGHNLCFAGHVDVVKISDGWSVAPFAGIIKDGVLYGRGVVDMKAAIAAFISAIPDNYSEKISLLISGNEEGDPENGTPKLLEFLADKQEKLDQVLIGEPTSRHIVGDVIKMGRRGSINFQLKINGISGHVAYPEKANNPNKLLAVLAHALYSLEFDDNTNLEITYLSSENLGANVIPPCCELWFNIRFSGAYHYQMIEQKIKDVTKLYCPNYQISATYSAESFQLKPGKLSEKIIKSVQKIQNITPIISMEGGTSDARFIKSIATDLVELGLQNETAHKIDESCKIADIITLTQIYQLLF